MGLKHKIFMGISKVAAKEASMKYCCHELPPPENLRWIVLNWHFFTLSNMRQEDGGHALYLSLQVSQSGKWRYKDWCDHAADQLSVGDPWMPATPGPPHPCQAQTLPLPSIVWEMAVDRVGEHTTNKSSSWNSRAWMIFSWIFLPVPILKVVLGR